MNVTIDGRCACCTGPVNTGGCSTCNSVRLVCACGALLRCGCGKFYQHACQNIVVTSTTLPVAVIA